MRVYDKGRFTAFILFVILVIVVVVNVNSRYYMTSQIEDTEMQLARMKGENSRLKEENSMIKEFYASKSIELDVLIKNNKEKLEELKEDIGSKETIIIEKDKIISEKDTEIAKLTKNTTVATRGMTDNSRKIVPLKNGEEREVLLEVTMYTNAGGAYSSNSPNYGKMANGEITHFGAAAGPKSLPFGTQVQLLETKPGFEYLEDTTFEIKDRGGAVKEKTVNGQKVYCIDIYTTDRTHAYSWGRNIVKGKIISK